MVSIALFFFFFFFLQNFISSDPDKAFYNAVDRTKEIPRVTLLLGQVTRKECY